VHDAFGIELDMRAFAGHPTVAGMAELVSRLRADRTGETPRLQRVSRDRPLPCAFAQERIWRFAHTPHGSGGYKMASVTGLHGPIDLEALRRALEFLIGRHEPLRTTFAERDGRPVQVIHPAARLELPLTDVSAAADPEGAARALLRKEEEAPFDLERGPLARFRVVRIGDHDHRLLRVTHHLISDRRSWRIFFAELVPAYEGIRRGQPPPADQADRLQYADFAAWERRRLIPEGLRYREQVSWWRGALESSPPALRLPFARPTPASGLAPREGNIWFGIDPSVIRSLDGLGREEGATHYTVRLALFSAALALHGRQEEVTLGAYVDTRRPPETHSMFGYFSNLVTLILPFDPEAPLRRWLAKVRYILIEASARGELPYEQLCDDLRASGRIPPEIRAIFGVRPPMPELPFGKAEQIPPGRDLVAMPWGFSFTVDQGEESNRCEVAFDAHLYDPAGVREFIDRYAGLAEAAGADPDRPLGELHADLC
jgi:hypothetical protein